MPYFVPHFCKTKVLRIHLEQIPVVDVLYFRLPLNQRSGFRVQNINLPAEAEGIAINAESLQIPLGRGVLLCVNICMMDPSLRLRRIVIERLIKLSVEIVQIDGLRAEQEVVEVRDENVGFQILLL